MDVPLNIGDKDVSFLQETIEEAHMFIGQRNIAGLDHPEYDICSEINPLVRAYRISFTFQRLAPQEKIAP